MNIFLGYCILLQVTTSSLAQPTSFKHHFFTKTSHLPYIAMQSSMHPSKLKSSQLPHYSRSPPFSKGNVVSPKELCAPHKETLLLFDINYSSKLKFKKKN